MHFVDKKYKFNDIYLTNAYQFRKTENKMNNMKLKLITLVLLIAHAAMGQSYLCMAKKADGWGYINEKGTFVIPPQYKKCFEFSEEGLAPVLFGDQYKFIDPKGKVLITEISSFDLLTGFIGIGGTKGFNNGIVPVKVDDLWGFLNTDGKLIIQPKYDKITEFYDDYAWGERGGNSYIISRDGRETPVVDTSITEIKHFSEGIAPFYTANKRSGFLDTKGQIAIPATFSTVGYFKGGYAWAKTTEGMIGYIDKTGKWIVQPQFEAANDFDPESKMARVRQNGQWFYINESNVKLNMTLDSYGDFVEGLCYGKKGKKVGFFDKKGTFVIAPQFEAVRDFKNGFAAAKSNGHWGIIDKKGKWAITPQFDGLRDMEFIK